MSELPFVSCLCPTYCRPKCVENAIACFAAQDYPAARRELVILDDAGQLVLGNNVPSNVRLISIKDRFRTLPEKFNALVGLAKGDFYCVWEDDDIYLPWHIIASVQSTSKDFPWCKPSKVWSNYGGKLHQEQSDGRFHASLSFSRDALVLTNGWPITQRADFDQQLIANLIDEVSSPANTWPENVPSYVFRWENSKHPHAQGFMSGDGTWYDKAGEACKIRCFPEIKPVRVDLQMDDDTISIYNGLGVEIDD